MQRKNEPVFCVSCQDEDLNEPAPVQVTPQVKQETHQNNYVNSSLDYIPPQMGANKIKLNGTNARSVSSLNSQEVNATSIEALRNKILWASQELSHSINVKYNIELCEMIKAASEAIISLKRTEID